MSYNEPPNYGTPPPPPGYGAPQGYGGQPPQSNSTLAIVSLVTGIIGILGGCCCGWLGIVGIAGIVTGVMARKEIDQSGGTKKGAGMALAGIICGAVGLVIGIILIILVFALGTFDYSYYSDF